ncbi:hypothetical protein C8J57DRAFT_1708583 [Mycena rebaudengoi]|nr:hypothetical protein C8J57DRAFT_1708583 [Mycena rebaudengoi]
MDIRDAASMRFHLYGERKLFPLNDPQLPRQLWEGLKIRFPKSIIFTPFFNDFRHFLVTKEADPNENHPMSGIGLDSGSDEGHWLEIAVKYGDVPLAYEIIRLGASVLYKNHLGFSPLYSGCTLLRTLLVKRNSSSSPSSNKNTYAHMLAIREICLLLLDHHSDANETHDGTSLLQLAYITASWDLIRALLIHGADPCPFATLSKHLAVPKKTDEPLYTSLTSELAGAERPPRLCPCGGGSALKNCHATFQAYPIKYICFCGSRKTYSACCLKRPRLAWEEQWNAQAGWLDHAEIIVGGTAAASFLLGEVEASLQNDVCREMMSFEPSAEEAETKSRELARLKTIVDNCTRDVAKSLAERGLIDPAFAAAVKKTGFVPIPNAVRSMARNEWKHSMANWNTAVDHYIASGIDHRSAQAIEEAAKVGAAGGPLYRKCEAPGCTSIEGRNSTKLFLCGSCKTTVYCGRRCQEIARTAHRAACKSGTVQLQLLPDQVTHFAELRRITTFDLLR